MHFECIIAKSHLFNSCFLFVLHYFTVYVSYSNRVVMFFYDEYEGIIKGNIHSKLKKNSKCKK